LQDNVPPFDSETALQILQTNLGAPPDMVFAEFSPTPIAAASLGQVRRAGSGVIQLRRVLGAGPPDVAVAAAC
jgi:predicted unusual protein kinase regulating ubiquinone biosynthesis (AarF/ABC1/UbiB family)